MGSLRLRPRKDRQDHGLLRAAAGTGALPDFRALILRQNMGSWAYYERTILAARSGDLGAIGLLKGEAAQVA